MADTIVEVPGVGEVSFPESMSDAEITQAIQRDILPKQQFDTSDVSVSQNVGEGIQSVQGADFSPPAPPAEPQESPVDSLPAPLRAFAGGVYKGLGGELISSMPGPDALVGVSPQVRDMVQQERERTEIEQRRVEAAHPIMTAIGEYGTTSLYSINAVRALAPRLAKSKYSLLSKAGRNIVENPDRFIRAELAAATLSGLGAGVAREVAPGSTTAEVVGAIGAPLAPAAAVGTARRVIRGGSQETIRRNLELFEQAGMRPSAGQVSEKNALNVFETVLASVPGGESYMRRFSEAAQINAGRAIEGIANRLARGADKATAGRVVEKGITGEGGFLDRFKIRSRRLFDSLSEDIALGVPEGRVTVDNTLKTFEEITGRFEGAEALRNVFGNARIVQMKEAMETAAWGAPSSATAKLGGEAVTDPKLLNQLRQAAPDLFGGGDGRVPYTALKDVRTAVGDMLADNSLIADAPKGQLKQLYRAITQDMEDAARAAGPEVYRKFQRANRFYQEGQDLIERTLQKAANQDYPEKLFNYTLSGSKDGANRILDIRRSLQPQEWEILAGAQLRLMGRAQNSAQDAAEEVFSTETFLTNWARMDKEAKRAMFSGTKYKGMWRELNDVAEVFSRIREGSSALKNPSGSARSMANILAYTGAIGGIVDSAARGGGILMGLAPLALGMTAANASARLMTSPGFIRWLSRSTSIPPERFPQHLTRLAKAVEDEDPATQEAAMDYAEEFIRD